MLSPDLIDLPIEVFGGYCPAIPSSVLPPGGAAMAQDVLYPQGAVRTRGGLANAFPISPIPANAAVNGLKSYLTPTLAQRLLAWDSAGNLWKENPQGFLNLVNSRPYQNLFYQSQTLFGREYQAFFDGRGGADIPRQFDDTNWDRVSQSGPGASPVASNFQPAAQAISNPGMPVVLNLAASPNGIVWGGFKAIFPHGNEIDLYTFFTVTTIAPHGFSNGTLVTLAGTTSSPAENGGFVIASVPSPTTFTVNRVASADTAANGGGGTVTGTLQNVSLIRQSNVVTANTTNKHLFQADWTVQISGFANIVIGGGIVSISQAGGVATCVTTTAHGLVPGAAVIITGTTNYNSLPGGWIVETTPNATTFTFVFLQSVAAEAAGTVSTPINAVVTIISVPTPTTFTYAQLGPDESVTAAGTATVVGNVTAGLHQVSVAFITRQGFITPASVPSSFYAAGSQLVGLAKIPTGPPNVIARLLLFTPFITPPGTTGSFYSLTQSMVIPDNTSTAAIADFLDSTLISGFQANYLFTQVELGESGFVIGYNSRLLWLKERAKHGNLVNLGFDGGFGVDAAGNNFPLGWTEDAANYAGGNSALAQKYTADWGDAYAITGDGVAAIRGKITQLAYRDSLNVPILAANTSYSIRARVREIGAPAQGTLHINLQSTLQGFTTGGLAVPAAQVTGKYIEFSAPLMGTIPVVPSDLLLQVYADGTPANGTGFLVDSIQIYPTNNPYNYSSARASHAFNPESYDGTTGQIQVRPGDGQALEAGFPLRNNLYLAKDHYLCYVADDGVNEPASWAVNEVSGTVGICGPNAVDWNEEWAVWAERSGAYICWGSDPVKLSPEIQNDASGTGRPSWASINWTAEATIWVRIDKANKMIFFGVPINGALTPNCVFMLDYRWLETAADIASSPLVTYSSFTGKILAHGRGRRWAFWNLAANSMTFAERADGSAQPFFGNGANNGKIYQQLDCAVQASDDGAAVNSQYVTYGSPSAMEEQTYQLGAHRKLLGYLKFRAIGAGSLGISILTTQRATVLRPYNLTAPSPPLGSTEGYGGGGYGQGGYGGSVSGLDWFGPAGDGERPVNIHGERFFLQVGTNAVGQWFQLEKLIPSMKKAPGIVVRGSVDSVPTPNNLSGAITDLTGNPIPNAPIAIFVALTGQTLHTVADNAGLYQATVPIPSNFTVTATNPGNLHSAQTSGFLFQSATANVEIP